MIARNNLILLNSSGSRKITFNKPGKHTVFIYNASGDFDFIIKEENVDLDIYGLFIGRNSDQFKLSTVQHHKAPLSKSNLLIKGVFTDQSKFHHKGLIRIEKKAQKTHAYQKNQNLILSSSVFVESEPDLEILANDVFCTHGSTTGRINADEVNYLKTRGLSSEQAKQLLVDGFINEVVNKIKERYEDFKYEF